MKRQLERKRIAPESIKTKRAREKLRKRWEEQSRFITEAALTETIEKIHTWIAVNAPNRVPLKEKSIRLFDQNQNAAALSQKVQAFAKKLYRETLNSERATTLIERQGASEEEKFVAKLTSETNFSITNGIAQ